MKKTILATTKNKADKMLIDSLFNRGGTLTIEKYSSGKYANPLKIGTAIEVCDEIVAIWSERRSDKDGKYYVVKCLTKSNKLSEG